MDFEHALHLISKKLQMWLSMMIKMLPNLLLATLILVIGIFLAKQLRNLAQRKVDKYLKHRVLGELLLNLIYVFAIGVVIFTALRVLKLDKTITTALAGAGIVGIALAFAFQDIAANFISGIFLTFQRPFFIGEAIRIKDLEGFVQDMSLRDTTLKTYQGQLIVIPNKEVFQNAITNYTRLGKRRADITGTLEATADLKKAQQVALTALHDIPGVIAADTLFLYENIGEGTVSFKAMVWLNSGERIAYLEFVSHIIIALTDAFKKNGIALPYPMQRVALSGDQSHQAVRATDNL